MDHPLSILIYVLAIDGDATAVFASNHVYVLPGAGPGSGLLDGAASVLSK